MDAFTKYGLFVLVLSCIFIGAKGQNDTAPADNTNKTSGTTTTTVMPIPASDLDASNKAEKKNETVVTYDEKDQDVGSHSNSTGGKQMTCYDCAFFKKGTKLEGNAACEFVDPKSEAGSAKCEGYCVKDWLETSALTSYLYVSRYCSPTCDKAGKKFGHTMVRTCCDNEDYCNTANPITTAAAATTLLAVIITQLL